ncbi:MAG: PEP-CTERM sorting domain-containing protein [Massilia sp.]
MNQAINLSLAALLTLGAVGAANAAPVTVSGNYIQMGVNNGGALIDPSTFIGIKYDPTSSGNFSSPIDYLTPGTPYAFYSIGVNGAIDTAEGGIDNNPFGTTTFDGSGLVGNPFTITNNGYYQGLSFKQVLFFDNTSQSIHASVVFTNLSGAAINNVAYGVGIDPDQDIGAGGDFTTQNTINGQADHASVTAFGAVSGYSITLASTSGWIDTVASIDKAWGTDPYSLSSMYKNDGNGDFTINLGYKLGDFAVGEQKSIGYDYTMSAMMVPEPEVFAMMLLGLAVLGVKGRKSRSDTFC